MEKGGYQIIDFNMNDFNEDTVITVDGLYSKVSNYKPILITNFKRGVYTHTAYANKRITDEGVVTLTFLLSSTLVAILVITNDNKCVFSMKEIPDSGSSPS